MKKILFPIFFLFSLLCLQAQETGGEPEEPRMDFEEYDPPSTLVVPENPTAAASFPFIDVHSHHWRMATMDLDLLIAQMDSLNMAIIVNLSGRGGEELQAMMENVKKHGYENRIAIFTNVDFDGFGTPGWTEKAVQRLEEDVRNGAVGLKIYKSLGMYNEDAEGERIAVDDPRIDPIWAKCGELGIPVLIHSADPKPFWEPHDANNERWLELKLRPRRKRGDDNPAPWQQIIEEQHNLFKKHSNTTFINAHFGWYANNLQKLDSLLVEIPNMYVEFGAVIAELGRQPRNARRFFEKYQDRILFGKDSYRPNEYATYFRVLETADEYFPYYKRYHAFWRMYGLDLPEEVLKKIYFENALKIIPGLDESLFEAYIK
ncbi:MAG: amidohydrolase family protein [Saprospiraceae bacterium]|nr:amidohydrolase family protein [Saprospiraceae bacterium]